MLLRSLLQPQRLCPGPQAPLCPALRFLSPCSGAGLRAHRLLLRKAPALGPRRLLRLIRPFVKRWLAAKRNIF